MHLFKIVHVVFTQFGGGKMKWSEEEKWNELRMGHSLKMVFLCSTAICFMGTKWLRCTHLNGMSGDQLKSVACQWWDACDCWGDWSQENTPKIKSGWVYTCTTAGETPNATIRWKLLFVESCFWEDASWILGSMWISSKINAQHLSSVRAKN